MNETFEPKISNSIHVVNVGPNGADRGSYFNNQHRDKVKNTYHVTNKGKCNKKEI